MIKSKLWLKCAGIRAIKTMAQTGIALISVGTFMSDINWLQVGSASLLAGILSILTSIAGIPEVEMRIDEDEEVIRSYYCKKNIHSDYGRIFL